MTEALVPPTELAARSEAGYPNESDEYRRARRALLAEEIDLRRHIERVAEQRRSLPPGGEVPEDYTFEGKDGPVTLVELFGDKDTLVVYSMMYGPDRSEGCPMCSSQLSSWDGNARDLEQRVGLAVVARSPIERVLAYADERGWRNLKLYSDSAGDYTRHYVHPEDADMPAYNVFTREGRTIRHFWSSEGGPETADPGQDPHDAPDMSPLWTILDTTPDGRGTNWYPSLTYDA